MKESQLISFTLLKPLALSIAVATIAACGTDKDESPSSSSESSSSSVSSEVSSSSVTSSSSSEPTSNTVYSDDFEGTELDSMWGDAGNVEVTTEKFYSGSRSVKFSGAGNGYNRNYITLDLDGTSLTDEMYGSMMIWIDTPNNGNGGDFTFIQAEGKPSYSGAPADTTTMYRYRVDGQNSPGNLMANYDTWIDANNDGSTDWLTDCWDHSNTQLPREQWSCVEWYFDKESDTMQFWLNGQEINEIHISQTGEGCVDTNSQGGAWYAPADFERLHLGIEQYHGGVPPRTVYIDDFAVGAEKLGCASE